MTRKHPSDTASRADERYQLFEEINYYAHATLGGVVVTQINTVDGPEVVRIHTENFFVDFHDQMAGPNPGLGKGLLAISTKGSPWIINLFNGKADSRGYKADGWEKLSLDTLKAVPKAPYVYRQEDDEPNRIRHLVRYEKTVSTGVWERTFIDSASLDDDDGLRILLQMTRNHASQDGGDGYYNSEGIWMQKDSRLGEVEGPEIPPLDMPARPAKVEVEYEPSLSFSAVLDALNDASDDRDIEAEYKAGLAFFRDHLKDCERDLTMAKHLVETFEAGDKVVQQLSGFSQKAATAARYEIVKQMQENVRVNLRLERKPRK